MIRKVICSLKINGGFEMDLFNRETLLKNPSMEDILRIRAWGFHMVVDTDNIVGDARVDTGILPASSLDG
jgi:hypothetical protein